MTAITVLHVPADDAQPVTLREIDREDLSAMQRLVGGDIDQVTFTLDAAAIFEEESVYRQPVNPRATAMLALYGCTNFGYDYHGDMFFTGVHGVEFRSVPPPLIEWFRAMGEDL